MSLGWCLEKPDAAASMSLHSPLIMAAGFCLQPLISSSFSRLKEEDRDSEGCRMFSNWRVGHALGEDQETGA